MSAYKSDSLRILAERGFIHQLSDAEGLDAKAVAGPIISPRHKTMQMIRNGSNSSA